MYSRTTYSKAGQTYLVHGRAALRMMAFSWNWVSSVAQKD